MKMFLWINENDLDNFNKLLQGDNLKQPIKVFNKKPHSWERYFQIQIEYNTYIILKDNNQIYA